MFTNKRERVLSNVTFYLLINHLLEHILQRYYYEDTKTEKRKDISNVWRGKIFRYVLQTNNTHDVGCHEGLKIEIHEIHQNLRNPVSLIGL